MAISGPLHEFAVTPVFAEIYADGERAIPIRAHSAPDQIASLRSQ
jgi:hypothetical protein